MSQYVTFSLKGLKTITNYQYEPASGILSLLDIFTILRCWNLWYYSNIGHRTDFFFTFIDRFWKNLNPISDLSTLFLFCSTISNHESKLRSIKDNNDVYFSGFHR